MAAEYHHNHYVPVWYQNRFIPPAQPDRSLFYLDLKPGVFTDPKGKITHRYSGLHKVGPKKCFAEKDLYTTYLGADEITEIEQAFFGPIDRNGKIGVEYFSDYEYQTVDYAAYEFMINYLSIQKLRTPKGLGWLSNEAGTTDRDALLHLMIGVRQVFNAIWTECVWLIADATESDTKFIISDHPVTVYNRRCGPRSQWCRGNGDPDIRFQGTHTIFPLSLEKILILTNSSWVRNPYQSEIGLRPNPNPWRGALFSYVDIQTLRHLSESEVREINFIIKSRANRYLAAANEEWLFPEEYVSKSRWNEFGGGYLLMPDPRPIHQAGEYILGYKDGTTAAFDEYGRRPGEPDYKKEADIEFGARSLDRFKAEFARLIGPYRRGRSYSHATLDNEQDDEKRHQYHLDLDHRRKGRNGRNQ